MSTLLSVIIPTLNEEDYLPSLLQDLQNQTKKNFEVIIVDGKSDDKTKEKALAFAGKLQMKFFTDSKRQVARQRNIGAEKATGKYLFFLDADTRIDKNTTQKIQQYISKEKKLLYLPIPKPEKPNFIRIIIFNIGIITVIALQHIGIALAFGPGIIIEMQLFKKIGKFNEKIYVAEDQWLVIKAFQAGIKARFMQDVNYLFSMRRGTLKITWQYFIFILATIAKIAIYKSPIKYEMGGHNFTKNSK